jgi:predicted nucleic acid-binding protein
MDLVVNASPLILLGKVGRIDLLREMCRSVCVPRGVAKEIGVEPDDPACRALSACSWLRTVAVTVPDEVKAWDLGSGESEVVAHALDRPGVRPLLDDAEGKACALSFGLRPLGTGGLLILAKQARLLPSVRAVLQEMRAEGLWISETVCQTILRLAGEL